MSSTHIGYPEFKALLDEVRDAPQDAPRDARSAPLPARSLSSAAVWELVGPGFEPPAPARPAAPPAIAATARSPRPAVGLLARYGAWLRRLNGTASLREIDPRLAQDAGISPGRDRCPQGFAADPRPLWGIGLTPQPMDVLPPSSAQRRG